MKLNDINLQPEPPTLLLAKVIQLTQKRHQEDSVLESTTDCFPALCKIGSTDTERLFRQQVKTHLFFRSYLKGGVSALVFVSDQIKLFGPDITNILCLQGLLW